MIRVNLLTVKRKKKSLELAGFALRTGVIAGIVLLALLAATFYFTGKVSALKKDKAVKERRLAELKEKLKEVANYERDNETYKKKTEIIERLKKNQGAPLRLLEEVSIRLPKGVWIESLESRGGSVKMVGNAFTNSDVVEYVQNMKESPHFANVALEESKQTRVGDLPLYQFKLSFMMKI